MMDPSLRIKKKMRVTPPPHTHLNWVSKLHAFVGFQRSFRCLAILCIVVHSAISCKNWRELHKASAIKKRYVALYAVYATTRFDRAKMASCGEKRKVSTNQSTNQIKKYARMIAVEECSDSGVVRMIQVRIMIKFG